MMVGCLLLRIVQRKCLYIKLYKLKVSALDNRYKSHQKWSKIIFAIQLLVYKKLLQLLSHWNVSQKHSWMTWYTRKVYNDILQLFNCQTFSAWVKVKINVDITRKYCQHLCCNCHCYCLHCSNDFLFTNHIACYYS